METEWYFSTHRYSDLLLIFKLKPYIKNICNAHIRHCGSRISGNLRCHQLQIHTGTGNVRQQKAFAVRLERPRQVGPESEEGGDGVRDGCLHLWGLRYSTVPQSDQFWAGISRAEQCVTQGAHRAQTGTSQRFRKPMKEKDGRSYTCHGIFCPSVPATHTWRVCCLAGPKHEELAARERSHPLSPNRHHGSVPR